MKIARYAFFAAAVPVAFFVALGTWQGTPDEAKAAPKTGKVAPKFQVDPFWPKLPDNWIVGQSGGIAVDSRDHIWILHRPQTVPERYQGPLLTPPRNTCCIPAPDVLEFDAAGNLIQAWGGARDPGFLEFRCNPAMGCEWPLGQHGIFVDHNDYVWIAGNGANDHQVLKFTRDGTFIMQIGKAGMRGLSHPVQFAPNGTPLLGRPADTEVDPLTNELYIADGYGNKRVIVVDAVTGLYKRHWGAYGNVPSDAPTAPYDPSLPPEPQFRSPVHCVRIANDGLVYVCDRVNNRIQVFQKDGTFVTEFFIDRNTLGAGSAYDVDLSQDRGQTFLHDVDGENQRIWTLLRQSGEILRQTGRGGRYAGMFSAVHSLAADSKGNLYTGEVDTGMKFQKFRYLGNFPVD